MGMAKFSCEWLLNVYKRCGWTKGDSLLHLRCILTVWVYLRKKSWQRRVFSSTKWVGSLLLLLYAWLFFHRVWRGELFHGLLLFNFSYEKVFLRRIPTFLLSLTTLYMFFLQKCVNCYDKTPQLLKLHEEAREGSCWTFWCWKKAIGCSWRNVDSNNMSLIPNGLGVETE